MTMCPRCNCCSVMSDFSCVGSCNPCCGSHPGWVETLEAENKALKAALEEVVHGASSVLRKYP